jgi:hypothetical protein
VVPLFTTSRYGETAFGQLALTAPREIAEGGENGTAMGAGHHLLEPHRRLNLDDALEEYLPFGLVAGTIFMT